MGISIANTETFCWAEKHFGGVNLFNRTKTKRLVLIASRLAENKGVSLARLFDRWYDVKATYHLLNHKIMNPDKVQSEHRKLTFDAMASYEGDVLAIEDGSEFEWNWKEPIAGLGPIGSGRKNDQGFILQSTLAVGIEPKMTSGGYGIDILGLPFQQYYVRALRQKKGRKRRCKEEYLESDLWRTVLQKEAIPRKKNIIRICDRAADIHEVLEETREYGCSYIIRLKHDRLNLETQTHIQEQMRELASLGMTRIDKRGKRIELQVNWKETELRAPQRPKGKKLEPLKSTVVHVWGNDPETGELLEWFLHTNLPINSLRDAVQVTHYYALRWIIEDYHKALKSGLRAEGLQFKTADALFATISIMSVVALRLINLRERLRIGPEEPAEKSGFSAEEIKVLGAYLKREIKTVKCVALAIGRLGGHQNRTRDGMPGLLALWWGMSRFLTIMEGVRLATI